MRAEDFLSKASECMKNGYVITAMSDEYYVNQWSDEAYRYILDKTDKLLEVRIFHETAEMKLFRSDISKNFVSRTIDDSEHKQDYYDEWQYLDIDEKAGRDANGKVRTTGGGKYFLPVQDISDAMIKIRYYLGRYEETGQARVQDWRVVGFGNDKRG